MLGTGQALRAGARGDVDLVMVHHRQSEEKFIQDGYGHKRVKIMYNHFGLFGPSEDPAEIATAPDVFTALRRIAHHGAAKNLYFISRGDDSGTHLHELTLWRKAGIARKKIQKSGWYLETGSGMGASLLIAQEKNAYGLTDGGTWLYFARREKLTLLYTDEHNLRNQYSIVTINRDLHPHIAHGEVADFIRWITAKEAQDAINAYRINGKQGVFRQCQRTIIPSNHHAKQPS